MMRRYVKARKPENTPRAHLQGDIGQLVLLSPEEQRTVINKQSLRQVVQLFVAILGFII